MLCLEAYQSIIAEEKQSNVKEVSDKIILQFAFERPTVTEEGNYCVVALKGLKNHGEAGAPVLPFRTVNVLIPRGRDISDINVVTGGEVVLDGKFLVAPGQRPIPTSSDVIPETLPDPEIYNSTNAYPESVYMYVSLQNFRGYRILILNLNPVKYIPKTGKISYFETITLTIETHPVKEYNSNSIFRGLSEDEERVKEMVDNPWTASTYTHAGKTKSLVSYDYVVITSQSLNTTLFQPLIDSKIGKGLTATTVTVEDIVADPAYWVNGTWGDNNPANPFYKAAITNYTMFNDTQAKIRNFIRKAYKNWGTEYVLLGGDADAGGVGIGGEHDPAPIIPHRGFYGVVNNDFPNHMDPDFDIPSDLYYGALNGTWNDDEDDKWGESGEDDLYAEVYVGRAPVDSNGEVNNFITKTLAYEHTVDDYLKEVLLVGELWWNPYRWGGDDKDIVSTYIPSSYNISRLYEKEGITWWKYTVNLNDYAGNPDVRVKFRVISNATNAHAGLYLDDVMVTAGGVTVFFDDMENGTNGWTHSGTNDEWELGTPTYGALSAYSGSNCWGTDMDSTYENASDQNLTSPSINLTGAGNAELTYYSWHYLEEDDDYAYHEVSTDGGITWTVINGANRTGGWPKEVLRNILNNDIHIVNHAGHSNVDHNMKLANWNVDALTNRHYFFVYTQGCYCGAFDDRGGGGNYLNIDCTGEHFVCQNTGAFAYIGSSRYGWIGVTQYFDEEFFDALYNENIRNIGIANQDSKEDNIGLIGTNAVRWCYYELNLFGDPEVSIKDPLPDDDWVVTGEDERAGPENIVLNGDIIVKSGGKLTLTDDIVLQLNSDYDGEYRIEVQDGGILQINHSILRPALNAHGFSIYIKPGGSFSMNGTSIIDCGSPHEPVLTVDGGVATVEDSYILSSESWGIYIYNSSKNTVDNTTLQQNHGGIYVSYSDGNNIINNNIQNNTHDGIYLENSNNNIIDNNVVRENNATGMHLYHSQGNVISNSSFCNNGYGLLIDYSSCNELTGNVLNNNDYNFGVNGSEEKDFYQNIDTSNTINGKPIYYLVNQTNPNFDAENAGYIGLVNVTKAKIENANILHNVQGILTANSSNVEIVSSAFTNNTCSMYICQSTNITVDGCIAGGSFGGIVVYGGGTNTVSNNTISGNEHGIAIGASYHNKIMENHFSSNSCTGIYLHTASFNIVGYNVFDRFGGSVYGFDSCWNMINNNNLSAGGYIRMESCSNETIANNTISESDVDAIYFDRTHNCIITNNTISKTAGQLSGIKLHNSNGNVIENDNRIYSNYYGIYLDASKENEILGNDIYSNAYGIYIVERSTENHINWNLIHGNSVVGVYVPREVTETVDAEDNWWGNYTGPFDNHNDTVDGGDYNPNGTGDNVTDYVDYRPWLYMNPKTLYIITQMYSSGELVVINATKLKIILFINTSSENKSAEKSITEKYLKIVIVEYESNPSKDENASGGILHLGSYFEIHIVPQDCIKLPVYIKIFYTQDELDRIGVNESRISGIYFQDGLTEQWQRYNNTGVNTTDTIGYAGCVWAYMDQLPLIGIFASNDTAPPVITHTPIIYWRNNTAIVINATITDDTSVESAVLFYRKATERTYIAVQMSTASHNVWAGTIPGSAVTSVGLEYYIWTTDGRNNATTPVYTVTVPTTTAHIIAGREVRVYYNGTGNLTTRNVTANERETLRTNLPTSRGDIGLFVDVNITGVFRDAFITIQYNDSDLAEADEGTLRMYYWNETTNEWILIPDSGVWTDNNTVWAVVTHLTIFAPMAEKVAEGITPTEPTEEGAPPINWVFYMSAVVAIATVIIICIVAVLRKRK